MKNQSFLDSFILRKKSSQRYDVVVSDCAIPQNLNEDQALSQECGLVHQGEPDSPKIRQVDHTKADRSLTMSRKGLFLALTLVFGLTVWAVFRHQSLQRSDLNNRVVDDNDRAVNKLIGRAEQHTARKQLELAVVDLNTAIQLAPLQANLYYRRALLEEQLGGYSFAIRDCDKVRDLSAGAASENAALREVKKLRKHCVNRLFRFEDLRPIEKLARFTKEIAAHPTAERLDERAELYELGKRPDLAIADLSEAVQLEPNNIDLLQRLAETRQALHRYSEAVVDYSKIIEWPNRFDKRDVAFALDARAQCYRELKKFDLAIADEQASDQIRAVASGKIQIEKLIPLRYRQVHHDPLEREICAAAQAVPSLLDLFPPQNRRNLTLAIDESIANSTANQVESNGSGGETNSLEANDCLVAASEPGFASSTLIQGRNPPTSDTSRAVANPGLYEDRRGACQPACTELIQIDGFHLF